MRQFVKFGGIIAVSLVLLTGMSGCGGGLFTPDKPASEADILLGQDGHTLWESNLQYVKIVNRDMAGLANEHPAALTAEELRTVLSSLYVSKRVVLKQVEDPLFSIGELQILSTAIANGLGQAQPEEDINFVTIGAHRGAIAKERKTNSGRVFISGGRLNIIFGLVHEEFREKDRATGQEIDRRLHPLLPGTRLADSKPNIRVVLDKGQSYYLDPETGKERTDWLVIDIATVLATAKERKEGDTGDVSPELLEDVARSKQATGNLRHDVSNIKEILFELSDEIERLKQQIEELKSKP
ncbi:MAG: hypothetical protein OEY48_01380 [Gammaproteobacteria bacterium]|nr:hypothetical protein [Gammaproteobacteria bacterium]MDH5591482.1 hypothetical protein [Gammaproteobacteria bacterium]